MWPGGEVANAAVCKTAIHGCKSHLRLKEAVVCPPTGDLPQADKTAIHGCKSLPGLREFYLSEAKL